jgi:hypothetical protein
MKFFHLLFFLLLFNIIDAQVVDLTGAIVIGNSEVMSYNIVYEVQDNMKITGYSITDPNGNSETKARITGTYNPRKKNLTFEERNILSTKVRLRADNFCLMTVDGKFARKNGRYVFTGTFTSKASNIKITCDSGTIVLATTKDINAFMATAAKIKDDMPLPDSNSLNIGEIAKVLKGVDKVIAVDPGSVTEYKLDTDSVQLDILDDRLEDGDMVTILKNKTAVVSNLIITNKVRTFKIPVSEREKVLVFTIIACNEGKSPPNTIKIVLTNGGQKELIIAQLKKDQLVKILLKRE